MKILGAFGVKNAEIDLSIARGLAYYTGLVFEFKLLNHPELGTAAGGGRYADLAGKFSKTKIIGVGAAIISEFHAVLYFFAVFLMESTPLSCCRFLQKNSICRLYCRILYYISNCQLKQFFSCFFA